MSVEKLQEKIRKLKNPSVVDFRVLPQQLPPYLVESEADLVSAYRRFCIELLGGLSGMVPAVRFSMGQFSLLGAEGMAALEILLRTAREKGFYILLDGIEMLSAQSADFAAEMLLGEQNRWCFDGIVFASYVGSDGLRPYIDRLKNTDKDLFAVVRTANRSAAELQDLLTGSRLVHLAKADIVNRYAEAFTGRSGYSRVAVMAAASSADSLRSLRSKYKNLFILVDGYDSPNANAKNCSFAFDKLGHGAIVCAGASVTAAWQTEDQGGWQYVEHAVSAAERMKKNLSRYVTVL